MYENQRQDFDIWGRAYRREMYADGPKLQKDPLARMMELLAKRSNEPVVYEQGDPNQRSRHDIETAIREVSAVMARLKKVDLDAYACLMARHARTFKDTRSVGWSRSQLPERMMAKAMFGGNPETAKSTFRRACERGYEYYKMLCAA